MQSNILSYIDEEHICPHCQSKMLCCQAPAIHVGDGLGWGSEALFICLNDSCSLFLKGWENVDKNYGHHASYRYMELPGSKEGNLMMVGNKDAFKASVVDPTEIKKQNVRYQKEQEAKAKLDTCIEENNLEPVLFLILDEAANVTDRKRAISLLKELNNLDCIEPIRNHSFRDTSLEQECEMIIRQLLKDNYMKECPFCTEIIKSRANKCMHCKGDV